MSSHCVPLPEAGAPDIITLSGSALALATTRKSGVLEDRREIRFGPRREELRSSFFWEDLGLDVEREERDWKNFGCAMDDTDAGGETELTLQAAIVAGFSFSLLCLSLSSLV